VTGSHPEVEQKSSNIRKYGLLQVNLKIPKSEFEDTHNLMIKADEHASETSY